MKFLDQAKIFLESGAGGGGCVSFRRERCVEYGGPDGGSGGKGGDIEVVSVDNLNTLIDFRYQQHFRAKRGHHGMGKSRTGAEGKSLVLRVPVGTQIWDDAREHLLADMRDPGQRLTLLKGGRGGLGNEHFKSSTNRAPTYAQPGEVGAEMWVWLHLKLIADVGMVGLPNAGKSTFLSVASHARPKIADYPFTTLHPQLGVVRLDLNREYVIADLPGLIEGAHEGRGLGHRFLGHAERCRALIHLVDATAEDVAADYQTIAEELHAYGHGLDEKPRLVVLNKADALDDEALSAQKKALEACVSATHYPVRVISAVSRAGVPELLEAVWKLLTPEEKF